MKQIFSSLALVGLGFVSTGALSAGTPNYVRGTLQYDTETQHPILIGVPQLTPPAAGQLAKVYKKLRFGGGWDYARGALVANNAGGPPVQTRGELSGDITYTFNADTEQGHWTNNTLVQEGSVEVQPWDPETTNWPQPPVLTTAISVSGGGPIGYGAWYMSVNNPAGLPVVSATRAAEDNVFHASHDTPNGNAYIAFEYQNYRTMDLEDEDTQQIAEARAKLYRAEDVRDVNAITSIRGTPENGNPWTIRKVHVTSRFIACQICSGGNYERRIVYERREIGQTAWQSHRTDRKMIKIKDDKEVVTEEFDVPLEEGYEIRVADVTFEALGENCASCDGDGGGLPGGTHGPTAGSIRWSIPLGLTAAGDSAGALTLFSDHVGSALYTPAALQAAVAGEAAIVLRDSQEAVRQVLAPQALADIVTMGAESYEIRFYDRAVVGAIGLDGLYAFTGDPYLTWRIDNPGATGSGLWRVTRIINSQQLVTLVDESVAGRTVFSEAGGLRVTETTESTESGDRVETVIVKNSADEIASKTKTYYRTFAWGEERVKEVLDPDGAALATEWTYVTSSSSGAYRKVASVKRPDGYTEVTNYEADAAGRPVSTTTPLLRNWNKGTSYGMSFTDLNSDGIKDFLSTTTESMFLSALGLQFSLAWGGDTTINGTKYKLRETRRATVPGAAWNASGNIVTRYRFYADGPQEGELAYRLNPDGTLLLRRVTANPDGGTTTVEEQGAADAANESVVDGTRSTHVLSARGQLVSSSVVDIASNRVLESQTVGQTDDYGRPLRILHLDGAEEVRSYCSSCGGVEQVSLRGETLAYEFDALGRKLFETRRAGSTTLAKTRFEYDAAGRLTKTYRIDPADESEILMASTTYDPAGRVVSQFSLPQGATGYSYAFGAENSTITTTTYADGGTRIESRGPSGTLFKLAGTTVAPVEHVWVTRSWDGRGTGYIAQLRRYYDATNYVVENSGINFLGEVADTTLPDGAVSWRYFDSIGRLAREVDPDGVTLLYGYDARGRQNVTAVDLDGNNTIDYTGTDRITRTLSEVGVHGATTVQRTITQVWEADGQDSPTTIAISETRPDGLGGWQTVRGLTTATTVAYDGVGGRTVTTTSPDGTVSTQTSFGDRLLSATLQSGATQLTSVSSQYDSLGRLTSTTDARTGATSYTYDASERLHTVTTPDPDTGRSGPGYDPQTTTYGYDLMGRVTSVAQPDGGVVHTTYYPHGQRLREWGSRTYPVEYTYDIQLRVKTLTTWQDFAGDTGKAVTTWNYDNNRGWLNNKRYADNTGPSYLYKPSGRLQRRTWARGVQTNYTYNAAGDLTGIDYSDTTPDVTLTYDRAGRPKTTTDAAGTRALSYHVSGQLQDEDYTAGLLNTLGVHRTFDSLSRLGSVSALSASSALNQIGYAYDAASRLDTVTSGTNTATYGYLANSPLVDSVTFKQSGATRLTTTKAYDKLNRLASINSQVSGLSSQVSAAYSYNSANQRTRAVREDNAYWDYAYDALGQVTSGRKYLADTTAVLGHDFAWSYDDIGNRKTATINAQISDYSANSLNQYSQKTVPGMVEVLGSAQPDAHVTVTPAGGVPQPVTRQEELFHLQLPVDNATAFAQRTLEFNGVKNLVGPEGEDAVTTITRRAFVPQTPELFTHDADGNLTGDARWTYVWDAENRLVRMHARPGLVRGAHRPRQIEFAYDVQGRRVQKRVTQPGRTGIDLRVSYYSQPLLQGTPAAPVEVGALDLTQASPSARWNGTLRVPATGVWTLKLEETAGRGYRLWLDGVIRFSAWPSASDGNPQTVTLPLEAGRDYALRVDCNGANSLVRLKWSGPDAPEQVIPAAWSPVAGPGETIESTSYLYDGWNLLAEVDATGAATRTYAWGSDLSGSLQGAGGVGGLLFATVHGSPSTVHCPSFDGNGNVIAYVDMATGTKSATYEYSAFGETLVAEGPMHEQMPFRFSTKYTDAETGLLYYGLRYYSPSTGRWPSRDPIEEQGGVNLYGFVGNNPVGDMDFLGLTNPNVPSVNGQPDFGSFPGVVTVQMPFYTGSRYSDGIVAGNIMQQNNPGWQKPPSTTWHHFSGNGVPQMQLVNTKFHESTYPHVGGFNFSGGYAVDRSGRFNGSQVAPAGAVAAAAAIEAFRGFLVDRFNRKFIQDAFSSCAQQRGSNPVGCGCCKVTIIKQWEIPATSGRVFGFGPIMFSPPSGESWIVGAYGDYAVGSCDKHPLRNTPTLIGGEGKTQEASFIKF